MPPPSEFLFARVLLIEDDPAHAQLIKRALRDYAHEVVVEQSVDGALRSIAASRPDLIVSDLHLRGSSTAGHIEKFRTESADAPVIVLTSSTALKDAVDAMKQGARDFIVKDFDTHFAEVLGLSLSRLFSSLALQAERLRFQREIEVLRVAIENSTDGLAVVGRDATINYSNSSFVEFVRWSGGAPESLLEAFGSNIAGHETLRENVKKHLSSLPVGAIWHTEVVLKKEIVGKDEAERAFDVSLSILRGDAGGANLPGDAARECVVWVRDITDQRRRERFQREILSTTTHDLKGPLGAIIVSADLLTDSMRGADPRWHELVVRISSCAQGSVNLIDEFLSARRIQEGNLILRPKYQDIRPVLEDLLLNYRAIADAKKIALLEEVPASIEGCVDKLGLSRVVGNLVSNALKFTPKGGTVTVRALRKNGAVHVEVQDTGTGMDPADVQKIFLRFSRLERHRDIEGSGIGLFVVKSIVRAHGGKVDVTSTPGKGTTFDVSFPDAPPVDERGELISLDFVG